MLEFVYMTMQWNVEVSELLDCFTEEFSHSEFWLFENILCDTQIFSYVFGKWKGLHT